MNEKEYEFGEGAVAFGIAAGGSDDWAHTNGVPICYTIELRDTGRFGFLLPEREIISTCREALEGVKTVYNHVLTSVSSVFGQKDRKKKKSSEG